MDRSFLSKPEVIAASRAFVCIRLATYESESEAALLKRVFRGRSGQLENTVFAILSPDGKRPLVRSGRSPGFAFFGAEDVAARQMARTMNRIAGQFQARRKQQAAARPLPTLANLRLAINVAACDNQPLVVAYSPKAGERKQLEQRLARLAWSDDFIGQFLYVSVGDAKAFRQLGGNAQAEAGVYIVEPGEFGTQAEVVARIPASADAVKLSDGLTLAVVTHQKRERDVVQHTRSGRRQGIFWKTEIPVTDSRSSGAGRNKRGRSARPRR